MSKTRTGWVYVLNNESIPGQVKIGFTTGRPEDRAKELQSSGVPTPYTVTTAFLFADRAYQIEQNAHLLLKDCRVSPDREFFGCTGLDAADAIMRSSAKLNEEPTKIEPVLLTPEEIAKRKRIKEEEARLEEQNRKKHEQKKYAETQAYIKSQVQIGDRYANGDGVVQNWREAVTHYRNAAKKGEPKAQNLLGLCYYKGQGVDQDFDQAKEWFGNASEQGYAKAHYNLARCLTKMAAPKPGELRGGDLDERKTSELYHKAAQQGVVAAQYVLGCRSPYSKEKWLHKAAEQDHAGAQYELGKLHESYGQYVEALKWLRPSAESGCAFAQALLADFYLRGKGVLRKDLTKARKLIEQAAATLKGDVGSCLKRVSSEGDGFEPNALSLLEEITSERVHTFAESIKECSNYKYLRKAPKEAEVRAVIKALDKSSPDWDEHKIADYNLIHNLYANFKRLRGRNSTPPPFPT